VDVEIVGLLAAEVLLMKNLVIWGHDGVRPLGGIDLLVDVQRDSRSCAVGGFGMKQLVGESGGLMRRIVVLIPPRFLNGDHGGLEYGGVTEKRGHDFVF
jgi:hypothetical protein